VEPKANPSNQWQVITNATEIPVYLVPDGMSVFYEMWSGGGVQRRCDGVECEMPRQVGNDYEMVMVPCVCRAEGVRNCRPYSRLQVIIPQVSFRGVWRLESKGWNAATELPGMYDMVIALTQAGQFVQARLGMEHREQQTAAGKRKFVVPRLSIEQTALQLQAGEAGVTAISASPTVAAPALPPAPTPTLAAVQDDIADGEIVDDELLDLEGKMRADARNFGMDENRYVTAVMRQANGDKDRMRACIASVRAGTLVPVGFQPNGTIQWTK
jgi:hypothetical protein